MSDDAKIKSTWASIFSRKGGADSETRLWEDWDAESRTEALRSISLQSGELPVVLTKHALGTPTILTTRQIFFESEAASVRDIVSVKPYEFTEKSKNNLNEFDIELRSGKTLRISTSPGPSYFALWNVLLHISKSNARKQSGL